MQIPRYFQMTFLAALLLAATSGCASNCARLANVKTGSYSCLEFSSGEISSASRFGITLGAPLSKELEKLKRSGWHIDTTRLLQEIPETEDKIQDPGMICGSGIMAICTVALTRAGQSIEVKALAGSNSTPRVTSIGPFDG
jgi:hypothetical protein